MELCNCNSLFVNGFLYNCNSILLICIVFFITYTKDVISKWKCAVSAREVCAAHNSKINVISECKYAMGAREACAAPNSQNKGIGE